MRLKKYLRWELVLALSLVGCTSVIPNRLAAPEPAKLGTASSLRPASLPVAKGGTLYLQVRWPNTSGFRAQVLPSATDLIKLDIRKKDGTLVQHQDLTKPTDGTQTVTYALQLDPALKLVDVFVEADGLGKALAKGQVLDVPVRDNTATAIAVRLDQVDSSGNNTGLKVRLAPEVALVKDLPGLAQRYDNLVHYGASPELRDLGFALQSVFGPVFRGGNNGPNTGTAPLKYRVQSLASPSFTFTGGGITAVDLLGNVPTTLYLPAFQASYAFAGGASGLHSLDVHVTPTGSDATTANLHGELTAGNWLTEPGLTQLAYGNALGSTSLSTQSIVLLGGMRPDFPTMTQAKGHLDITPRGIASESCSFDLGFDQVRDVSSTAFFQFLQQKSSSSIAVANWPGHATFIGNTPSIAATADIKAADDFLGGQASGSLRLTDKQGANSLYNFGLGLQLRLGPVNGVTDVAAGDVSFAVDDVATGLRLKGTVHIETSPPSVSLTASFVDNGSNTVLGTLNYNLPIDANGHVDFNHLSSWPVLTVIDPADPTHPVQYNLTPGFFSGQTTGEVVVEVR